MKHKFSAARCCCPDVGKPPEPPEYPPNPTPCGSCNPNTTPAAVRINIPNGTVISCGDIPNIPANPNGQWDLLPITTCEWRVSINPPSDNSFYRALRTVDNTWIIDFVILGVPDPRWRSETTAMMEPNNRDCRLADVTTDSFNQDAGCIGTRLANPANTAISILPLGVFS